MTVAAETSRTLARPARLLFGLMLLTVALAGCRGGETARPQPPRTAAPVTGVAAVPTPWATAYAAPARAEAPPVELLDVADEAAAAEAVRAGRARFALTTPAAAHGLATAEFASVPLALVVPLTFPVEDVPEARARDVAAGRVRDWRELGGPPATLTVIVQREEDRPALRRALGEEPAANGSGTNGAVRLELGLGDSLTHKALRIDGRLPGEAAYPLVDRRVVAAKPKDAAGVEPRAALLRERLAAEQPVAIVVDGLGDVMLGRDVGKLLAKHGPEFAFAQVQPLLAQADLRVANLELPLTDRGVAARKDYVFRAPPPLGVAALKAGGIDAVSLANNHAMDYGAEGILDTLAALDAAGIARFGAGRTAEEARAPAIVTVKGLRVALVGQVNVPNDSLSGFVARSMEAGPNRPGVAWATAEAAARDVRAAKQQADLVIFCLHAGFEYQPSPNPLQRQVARAAIDAGAALVLGAHPHVLQGMELYKGAPISYSLGNFVFDLDDDDRRQPGLPSVLTVIMRVTLTREGATAVRFLPAVIDAKEARPVPVSGADARPVLDRLYRLTDALR